MVLLLGEEDTTTTKQLKLIVSKRGNILKYEQTVLLLGAEDMPQQSNQR